jgi:hypothetical protein
MAISRKYRRPITVRAREFLWWVYEDLEEAGAMTLAVASADKRFLIPTNSRPSSTTGERAPGAKREIAFLRNVSLSCVTWWDPYRSGLTTTGART